MPKLSWKTIQVPLGNLKEWDKNPAQISERDAKQLARSLDKFGYIIPFVAAAPKNGKKELPLLDGHQRKAVELSLRHTDPKTLVDVRVPNRPLTEKEKQEAVIRMRSNTGEYNPDALLNWFDGADLLDWGMPQKELESFGFDFTDGSADAEPQIDRAAELLKKWKVRTGDLFAIGEHRLICGDCTDAAVVARVMEGERADCVFTSPPYAVGVDYGETYQDTIDNLREMLPKLSKLWLDFIVDGGFAVVNFGDIAPARNVAGTKEPSEYPMALEYYPVFRADGWLLWSRRVWCKPNARVNSLWCIGSNRAATDWEHIWTFRKQGEPIIKRVDGNYRSSLGWFETSQDEQGVEKKETHGAGMPILTAQKMIAIHSRTNSIVYESFAGTGTTLVACQNLNRRGRAIEISPAYCAVTLERMAEAFPGIEIKRVK